MKHIIATTACFITATVVCARISSDDLAGNKTVEEPLAVVSQTAYSGGLAGKLPPSAYGVLGAAALTFVIAARRVSPQES